MSGFPIRREQDCLVVELSGQLTAADHFRFLETSVQLAEDSSAHVIVDFSRVESLEAAAYQGLTQIFQLTLTRGGEVYFVGIKVPLQATFESSGLAQVVEMRSSVPEAVASLSRQRWW